MGKYTNSGAGLVVYRGLAINPFKWYDIGTEHKRRDLGGL